MRIAMLCSNHPVNDARVVFKQAASLAKAGHEVRVFGLEAAAPVHLPGVTVEAVYPFKIGIRARLSMIPRLYRPVLRWKPDVVTGHEPETAALGLHLRSLCGARVVFDVHELWQEMMAERAPRLVRPLARRAICVVGVFGDGIERAARLQTKDELAFPGHEQMLGVGIPVDR